MIIDKEESNVWTVIYILTKSLYSFIELVRASGPCEHYAHAGSTPVTCTKQEKSETTAGRRRVRICCLFRLSEFHFQARQTKNEIRRSRK